MDYPLGTCLGFPACEGPFPLDAEQGDGPDRCRDREADDESAYEDRDFQNASPVSRPEKQTRFRGARCKAGRIASLQLVQAGGELACCVRVPPSPVEVDESA